MNNLEFLSKKDLIEVVFHLYKKGNLETYIDDTVCSKCERDCGGKCILTDEDIVARWLLMEVD